MVRVLSHPFPPPPPFCSGFIYTVQPGDTMFLIAQRFGVSLDALIAANPQLPNPGLIFPGQQICVPAPFVPHLRPFVQQLQQFIGHNIKVALEDGSEFAGRLQAVFSDHILLVVDSEQRYIRIEAMMWFAPLLTT